MPGTKPATLAQRLHAKDWDQIREHHRENILANEAMTREHLVNELAHNLMKKQQLGEKLTRWAQLIGQAAGVDPSLTLGDDEAEAMLVAWATVGRFKPRDTDAGQAWLLDFLHRAGESGTVKALCDEPDVPVDRIRNTPWPPISDENRRRAVEAIRAERDTYRGGGRMSAYWKGRKVVDRLPVWTSAEVVVAAFLDALPPSIVVDGRVIAVSADGDTSDWLVDACEVAGISLDAFAYVFEAAREVTE